MESTIRFMRSRPRVGLVGEFYPDEMEHFEQLFPTIWKASDFDDLEDQVQVNELDLIVISRNIQEAKSRMDSIYCDQSHVICFSNEVSFLPGPTNRTRIVIDGESRNEESELPNTLTFPLDRRREADLAKVDNIRDWSYLDSTRKCNRLFKEYLKR